MEKLASLDVVDKKIKELKAELQVSLFLMLI